MYELIDNILVEKKLLSLRINCDLDKCLGACCYGEGLGSPMDNEDMSLVSAASGLDPEEFSVLYRGVRLKTQDKGNVKGECIFLKDQRCTIYDFRPKFCALFPLVIKDGVPFKKLEFKPYSHCVFKKSEKLFIDFYRTYLEMAFGQRFVKELFGRVR